MIRTIKASSREIHSCMVHNNVFLTICIHLNVVVEECSRKSQMLAEGVTLKGGFGGGSWREKRDYWNQDGRFFNQFFLFIYNV